MNKNNKKISKKISKKNSRKTSKKTSRKPSKKMNKKNKLKRELPPHIISANNINKKVVEKLNIDTKYFIGIITFVMMFRRKIDKLFTDPIKEYIKRDELLLKEILKYIDENGIKKVHDEIININRDFIKDRTKFDYLFH